MAGEAVDGTHSVVATLQPAITLLGLGIGAALASRALRLNPIVGYIGLGLTTDPVVAWLLIGVYGLFTACTDGVGKAWVSSLAGADRQATAQGVFQGGSGLAILVAGVWAGLLWGADGRLPLLIAGVVGGCFALALLGRWAVRSAR